MDRPTKPAGFSSAGSNKYILNQVRALELAIEALTDIRRQRHAMGEVAYTQQGIRDMTFAESGHKGWEKYTEAIKQLEDLIDILKDPGPTIEPSYQQRKFF